MKTVLRLYIAGHAANGREALKNVTRFCERHLHGSYALEVVDLLQDPHVADAEAIVATPTLVRLEPGPREVLLGPLADEVELARLLVVERPKVRALSPGEQPAALHP